MSLSTGHLYQSPTQRAAISETLAVQELRWTPEGYVIGATATAGLPFQPEALPGFAIDLQRALEE
ncbi:MAG: hypothetical protein WHS44_12495 [Fimbriimonadales bacterium]|nr:MAG: hypothetical protein KatS3mg018_1413 [Fimbriimonadales bacterium]